jgi:two-component sensor histidine kinase
MLAVADVFITDELARRPFPQADYLREKLAIQDLARQLADNPAQVLPRLVALAMDACGAASAGLSLYEPGGGENPGVFRWHHLKGRLARFEGATTPRNFSPCGVCLDAGGAVLSKNPERVYDWIADAGIVVPEVLLVPLYSGEGAPLGTLWVVAHEDQQFNAGHARVTTELAAFVGLAYRMIEHERQLTLALNQEQAVAREMSHRVKNVLTIASSLAGLTARSTVTPSEFASALIGRFKALERAHSTVRPSFGDRLLASGDFGELVATILDPYRVGETANIQAAGPPLRLSETAIRALAMTLHEFATNAAKYGALSDQAGSVSVGWEIEDDGLVVHWRESGGPLIESVPARKGFGSELARRSIEQLGGALTYHWRPEGLCAEIIVPLPGQRGMAPAETVAAARAMAE